eukprot:760103-Hanusia_phi.AAC.2
MISLRSSAMSCCTLLVVTMLLVSLTRCGGFAGEPTGFDGFGRQSFQTGGHSAVEKRAGPELTFFANCGSSLGMKLLQGCAEGFRDMLTLTYEDTISAFNKLRSLAKNAIAFLKYCFVHLPGMQPVRRLLRIGKGETSESVRDAGATDPGAGRGTGRKSGAQWHAIRWTSQTVSTAQEGGMEGLQACPSLSSQHVSLGRRWISEGKGMLYAILVQIRCMIEASKFSLRLVMFLLFGGSEPPQFGSDFIERELVSADLGKQDEVCRDDEAEAKEVDVTGRGRTCPRSFLACIPPLSQLFLCRFKDESLD